MTRFAVLVLTLGLAACAAEPAPDAAPPVAVDAESQSLPVLAGTYVFELSAADQAELDAARAAHEADPTDADAKAAFNRIHGRTFGALQVSERGLHIVGQGQRTAVDADSIEAFVRPDGAVELEWAGDVVLAHARDGGVR
ncbi:MAG: hypothetical protein GY898_08985 [Proteobacteria bacterium]|nr:hypothetical protein [Pseudomonadota bacterium]